jgi:hypothetical protein
VVGGSGIASIVHIDSTGVGLDALGVDIGGDWTTGEDLGHDILISTGGSVFLESDFWVLFDWI